MVEDPEVLSMPDHKGFQFVACNIAPKQDCYPVLKALKLDIDLASFWAKDLSRHLFPEYGDFIHIELFTLASNFLSQSVYIVSKNSSAAFTSAIADSTLTFSHYVMNDDSFFNPLNYSELAV